MNSLNFLQIVRFLCSGAVGALLYYTVLYTLTDFVGILYIISASIAGVLNWISNFIFHKLWTFGRSQLKGTKKEVTRYIIFSGPLYVLNLVLLFLLVEYLHIWYIAAQVIVTVVITIVSFFITRKIFSD